MPLTAPFAGMAAEPLGVTPTLVFTLMALTVIHWVGSSRESLTMFSSICRSMASATEVLKAT